MKKKLLGFTLIELIIVIIIISVLAKIASARWPGTKINVNAQAQQLANDLRYTQNIAMSRGTRYRLNFLSSTSYSITDINNNIIINPITGTNTILLNTGITITLPPTNLPNNLIAFDTQGIPYTDSTSTTLLNAAAVITLTAGANTSTVTITPQTGRITVS